MGHFLGVRLEVFAGIFEVVLWYIAVFYGNIDKIIDNDAMLCVKSLTCSKNAPLSPIKYLVLLKKTVKLDFQPMKMCSWCVWKCPEWILSVFMHFCESPDSL